MKAPCLPGKIQQSLPVYMVKYNESPVYQVKYNESSLFTK
jgi:hypothetical protein